MARPRYPSLYQINTRVWLTALAQSLGRPATLDDIPDVELDRLAESGFDWIWFLSVWQTGPGAQQVSRDNPGWRREFQETLPDLREEDIAGSGFAITGYTVHENLGGDAALARLRERLRQRGLKLMLDFVPNHMGLGHPWIAAATFSLEAHQAAAVITFLSPGLRFFHQGQFEGRHKRMSPHLVRGPDEPVDQSLKAFYERLLAVLRNPIVRNGQWQLLECTPGWEGNGTNDCFVVFAWHDTVGQPLLVAVNYAAHQSQCHVRLPFADLAGKSWQLQDQLRTANYDWNGNDLVGKGLYLDAAPWQASVFTLTKRD